MLERFPRLAALLASGFVSAEDKVKIVDRTFAGRVSPVVLNLLRVLATHERLEVLRDVVRAARTHLRRVARPIAGRGDHGQPADR